MGTNTLTFTAPRLGARSLGLKLIVICALVLLMGIPALFVYALIQDRTQRAREVVREVAATVGGDQVFLGPVLVLPYSMPTRGSEVRKQSVEIVYPERGSGEVATATEVRHRSLFQVPVYEADLVLDGTFDLSRVAGGLPAGAEPDWSRAELVVGISDARGAKSDATMAVGGETRSLAPATTLGCLSLQGDQARSLCFFGTPAGAGAERGRLTARADLKFSGAQRLAVLAFGKTTQLRLHGDWPNPGFEGGFTPTKRNLSAQGFDAEWSVPFIARGVPEMGESDTISRLGRTEMGVRFVELADPYQSVNRALKYVLLFVALVFLTYFIFEVTTGRRVHPAQYVLIGVTQIIFYLLLLSFAERIGFNWGFGVAAVATVALISLYALWVFESRREGVRALAVFSLLYGMIYVLLRLEDQALLVGAIASFTAVAAVMYFTRRVDWYGSAEAIDSKTIA